MRAAITDFLRQDTSLVAVWNGFVLLFALYLFALAALIFIRRDLAINFLSKFASTPQINALEAFLRLLVGVGLVGASPDMQFSQIAFYFGALLVVTAIPMFFLQKTHARYAKWALKILPHFLWFFGVVAFALGALVIFALA